MNYEKGIYNFPSSNGVDKIAYYIYTPKVPIKAVLQISHGMCEYIFRYEEFADYLCGYGILVCGNDHLGHGNSASSPEMYGYFAPTLGFKYMYRDLNKLTKIVKNLYPNIPYFLFGHSMGSFLARLYMAKPQSYLVTKNTLPIKKVATVKRRKNADNRANEGNESNGSNVGNESNENNIDKIKVENKNYANLIDGCIFCGTSGGETFLSVGQNLGEKLRELKGEFYRSERLQTLVIRQYNLRFKGHTDWEWLTGDEEVNLAHSTDEKSNFVFTVSGFMDLFHILARISNSQWAENLPKELPYLIISGKDDPVGNYGVGVKKVYNEMKKNGIKNVKMKLYRDCRHELLNDKKKKKVYKDILNFILDQINF